MLRADGVGVVLPDGRRILGPVSIEAVPGRFTALLGPSGSGKTTLLRALAGVAEPTEGTVELDGVPAADRVEALGYVPQRESVHDRLTVREALRYAAVLRTDGGEGVDEVVDEVLAELDLVEQSATRIGDRAGGERRRAACGMELGGRPEVLLLDEPTSGLDPVLERRLMALFRRLADGGRAVVVVTHATASLGLCDEVVVLGPDGRAAASGPPAEAAAHLERVAAAGATPAAGARAATPVTPRPRDAGPPRRPFVLELGVLAERYARTLRRDRRTLAILLGQAPVIGLFIATLFGPGVLDRPDARPGNAAMVAFLLMTGAVWLGVTSACREVVKERGILEREFDVGLRLDAYVLAKAVVLFGLTALQVTLMTGVLLALQPPDAAPADLVGLLLLGALTAWTSVGLGLLVSTLARSVDQAAGAVPLLLIPQLLFAGALVPLVRMPDLIAAFAQLTYARWAYAGMGSALDVDGRLRGTSEAAAALGFDAGFFALSPGAAAVALLAFLLTFLLLATVLLTRRAAPVPA